MLAGTREHVAELDQPGRVGAVVAVDGLVVVADAEHGRVGPGQEAHQQNVRRGEVLELVDQQQPTRPLRCGAGRGVAQEQLDGFENLLVVIDGTGPCQVLSIAGERLGETVDLSLVAALDPCRIEEPEACKGERLQPGGDGVGVAHPWELDEAADDPAHFGLVDGVEPLRLASERRAAVDDCQRDRVQGADL